MTPDEFADKMWECFPPGKDYDKEASHANADYIILDLLESLGYKKGADIFRISEKWYA